jgi:glyoxylase-like metal-dependent hydrolase (beta-lactamase superfamily II)
MEKNMENFICATCGVQYAATERPPAHCPICEDERQYIGKNGQRWTTLAEMQKSYQNRIEEVDPNLTGIGTTPSFAIGQRGLLVQTPNGNVLWDCVSLIDDATVEAIHARGGIQAIAVSHPHTVGSLVEFSHAFGKVPIYWHADNREWAMRPDPVFEFWEGETCKILDGLTLIRCGGHFLGSDVLHWATGAEGQGALLTGDTIYVTQDRRFVSFMYSYPNLIPLKAKTVQHIVESVEPYDFDRIYGGWWDSIVKREAKAAVKRSAERYIRAIHE